MHMDMVVAHMKAIDKLHSTMTSEDAADLESKNNVSMLIANYMALLPESDADLIDKFYDFFVRAPFRPSAARNKGVSMMHDLRF